MAFDLGPALFCPDPPAPGVPGGAGRSTVDSGSQCAPQQIGQTRPSGGAVLQLRTMLLRADGEDGSGQRGRQPGQDELTLSLAQSARGPQIKAQLHPGIGCVDALPART